MPIPTAHRGQAPLTRIEAVDGALTAALRAGLERVERELRSSLTDPDDPFLSAAAVHLIDAGGKRLRPLIVLLGAEFGDPRRPGVVQAGVLVELVHVASLYHDDVMDEAPVRHGVSSANKRWNNSVAVLVGDFLLARAAEIGVGLGDETMRMQAQAINRLVRGQILETVGPGEGDTVAHCIEVMRDKSAALLALAARLGGVVGGAPPEVCQALATTGEQLGIAFQISDDLIDILTASPASGKTPGTDLRQGVLTIPVLYAMQGEGPGPRRLREILAAGPVTDDALVAEALELLRGSEGLERAAADVTAYADRARQALSLLPAIPARQALEELCDYIVSRDR
ncbi:polyprenyl synthetase family protein [Allonocardiopsis opalescens]|uniref:Heptaprenyl diphosphate synthase n=1 Tax=Allonocardiopsis opalescens TaxID=1144618 RepID=A0A2T0QCT7_9ACTN|nr:polyprenyl synthetase family protein [Allonocardiopsis opalescens]PRY01681.1 heptaprenyl diphosphate synthase [Allonocardiopsis opalescens]